VSNIIGYAKFACPSTRDLSCNVFIYPVFTVNRDLLIARLIFGRSAFDKPGTAKYTNKRADGIVVIWRAKRPKPTYYWLPPLTTCADRVGNAVLLG
jgi:hypothetical protein